MGVLGLANPLGGGVASTRVPSEAASPGGLAASPATAAPTSAPAARAASRPPSRPHAHPPGSPAAHRGSASRPSPRPPPPRARPAPTYRGASSHWPPSPLRPPLPGRAAGRSLPATTASPLRKRTCVTACPALWPDDRRSLWHAESP